MAEAVAHEMALTFEAFVRDMLKPAAESVEIEAPKEPKKPAAAPPPPASSPTDALFPDSEPDAPKKSDFWQ